MSKQYEINGLYKHAELDNFENGCEGRATCARVDLSFKADTIPAIIKLVCDALSIKDDSENYQLDSCDEPGRIDFQLMETADGFTATESQQERWREGRLELWACTYIAKVQLVTRETVSLTK